PRLRRLIKLRYPHPCPCTPQRLQLPYLRQHCPLSYQTRLPRTPRNPSSSCPSQRYPSHHPQRRGRAVCLSPAPICLVQPCRVTLPALQGGHQAIRRLRIDKLSHRAHLRRRRRSYRRPRMRRHLRTKLLPVRGREGLLQ
ncbi:hypothetical protein CRUP_001796, partial [Coryphaenoides rupestris]